MKGLLAAIVLVAASCGSSTVQYRDDNDVCVERWRAWAIWQFDERTTALKPKDCYVP